MITHTIEKALRNKLGCSSIYTKKNDNSLLNQCFIYDTDQGSFFVKVSRSTPIEMFAAEAYGLQSLEETKTVRVPKPYYYGYADQENYLIMEYVQLLPHTTQSMMKLGEQLAALHLRNDSKKFGFEMDNTIGTTPQHNTWHDDWVSFFRSQRLECQLNFIEKHYNDNELRTKGDKLLEKLPSFFYGLSIQPSLLHGDLWSGNTAIDSEGNPIIYDPAVYYGHSEADLSIAKMFGGFKPEFFSAYHQAIPQAPGFDERIQLYQLYHYLNHYLLFGKSYRPACCEIIEKLR